LKTYKSNGRKGLVSKKRRCQSENKKLLSDAQENLRVHHCKIVKEWVEENKKKIALFFIPSYSQEMNP
jgi:transposase